MGEFSKFKALTAVIILLFIFSIAAMYTNTKDAAEKKMNENNKINVEKNQDEFNELNMEENKDQTEETNSDIQIQKLTERVTNLENASTNSNNSAQDMRCNIKGIVSDGGVVPLSAQESITEAKMNNKEIVITCHFGQ